MLQAGKFDDALDVIGVAESGPIDDVIGVRLVMGRGLVLASLVRLEASAAALETRRVCWFAAGRSSRDLAHGDAREGAEAGQPQEASRGRRAQAKARVGGFLSR